MTRVQEVRHECLLQLYGSGRIPISAEHIQRVARRGGFRHGAEEIKNALHFLVGQGFAERVPDPASGEERWRITSAGMIEWELRDG